MKVYTDWRMFFTASALLLLLQWSSVAANFNITFSNFNFDHPNNTDARGMCCNQTEGRGNCSTPCNIAYIIHIPSSGSTFSNESDRCPNRTPSTRRLTPNTPNGSYSIPRSWTGRLQLLICIEENQDDRNLVATFLIEHISTAAQPNDTELPEVSHTERGRDGAMLSVSIYVQCNTGFYGPSCDCQNTNDSTGHYTCTREGGIQCLDGYQNPQNNCTELQMPGPTVTSPSATTDVSDTSGMFTTSLAIMIDFMSTPVAFTSLLIDPVLTTMITPFTSSLSSLQGPPLTTPAPTSTGIAILTTPVVISTPITSISLASSLPVTSGQFQTTTPPLLTTSLPLITTSVQIQTTIEPSLTTVLPSLSTTTTPLTSSLALTTTQEPEPTITASTEPSTTTTISIETTLSLTTTRGPQPTISASVGTTSSTEPSSRSGNAAVIAGTVVVLTVVVASILVIAVCVYFVVKKKQKKSKLESIVYLDQVYNTPVTFVNPEHEGVSPRSPPLIMTVSGDQENGVEMTHTPSFPSVDYRAHIPYAETGPSSDHTQSPANEEGSQVYQFHDGETTIIANPHSWSRSSESPPPLPPPAQFAATAPASEQKNRKSGLGLNDSIGGAKYNKHLPSASAQSSRSEGGKRQTSSSHLTVPHLSPRGAPKTTPKPPGSASRGSGREGELHKSTVPARPRESSYGRSREREEEEEGMQKRVNDYLQSAQEEGERRQSFMKDILFTDINLDMTTQTEL